MTPTHLSQIPPEIAAAEDYMPLARSRLSDDVWAYIHSGSANEQSFREDAVHMLRVLRDELQLTLVLCGCSDLDDISCEHLWETPSIRYPLCHST